MIFKRRILSAAVGVVLASGFLDPSSALAQDRTTKGLEEVIVTARKTEENIQNIPVAITSLSSDDLVKNGILNVKDINNSTPSMTITQAAGNPVSPRVALRGQVQNDTVFTLDPSVGIYLDEIYVGRAPGAMFDFYDIQRVEILKGPQGTLYGRNTTGGAMKIITNRAETGGDLGGYVKGGLSNYNGKTVEGAINIPIIENKLAARVAGIINKRDGYSENTIVDPVSGAPIRKIDTGDKDTQSARFDLILNATDKFDLELQGDYSDIDTHGLMAYNKRGDVPVPPQALLTSGLIPVPPGFPAYVPIVGNSSYQRSTNDRLKASTNVVPTANNIAWGVALTATYTFDNDMVAKAVYGHREMDGKYTFDVDGTSLGIVNTAQAQGAEQDTVELQLTGSSFDSLDWTVGAYWYDETGYEGSGQTLFNYAARPQGALSAPYNADGENKSKSVYGQATWHFTDTLSFTGGVRPTWDTKALVSHNYTRVGLPDGTFQTPGVCNFTPGAPGITIVNVGGQAVVCESDQSKNYKHISWTAGIDWQVLDDLMVYLKSSNGYRAGGQNLRGTFAATLIPFDSETVTDIEAGLKSTLWDNRLRANLAVFHSNYKDVQATVFVPNPAGGASSTQVVNLTNSEIDGAELELTAQLLDPLVVNATASYTDQSFPEKLSAAEQASYPQGLVSTFSPRWKYSIGGTYTQQLDIGELSYNLNYAWRDGYWANISKTTNQTPTARTDAVGLLNARVALELTAIDATVGLWGTNLADKRYVQNSLAFAAGGPTFINTNAQEPRMFGMDITKRF